MNHNVSLLTSVANIDALLETLNEDKARLQLRETTISHRIENGVLAVEELTKERQDAELKLAQLNNYLPNTVEGIERNNMLNDINDLKSDIIRINRRMRSNGPVSMYSQQVDASLAAARIQAMSELIAQLQTRRTELGTQ
jgi:hypothetical protein